VSTRESGPRLFSDPPLEKIGALKLDAFLPKAEVKRARGWEGVPRE